jgi:hypothetical protein
MGAKADAILATAVELGKQSIQFGSPITGAPGQPVATGALRNSWHAEQVGDAYIISTPIEYAQVIEDGINPKTGLPLAFKSTVGGAHSLAITRTNWNRIVDAATKAHES